ncbi:hypothetical protein I3F58_27775 [Streptomyces sp. MUM 203J]|uniref:hypothetical protein n=1 Tax=Streptomyces sp. MUM 203J TaxID=2791990 RepID=UPI001F04D244|nr:hypothetical protein [Streptomyces sp. MUM 203J]MCH0543282.1 hypothetical protein [Streptomyces sp. MUM 203J]
MSTTPRKNAVLPFCATGIGATRSSALGMGGILALGRPLPVSVLWNAAQHDESEHVVPVVLRACSRGGQGLKQNRSSLTDATHTRALSGRLAMVIGVVR